MTAERIVVVEDDAVIGPELRDTLSAGGYEAVLAADGRAALAETAADLVLLDLGLPDMDGVELCRTLRIRLPQAVIVVLTARVEESEVVMALDAGADDYLTKPFRLAELMARIRAHLRRRAARPGDRVLNAGRLRLDVPGRRAYVSGAEVTLRPKEFDLLAALVSRAGEAVSRERLMDEVWDANWFGPTKTLDVHVSTLRRKLSPGCRITTLRGRGYRFEVD